MKRTSALIVVMVVATSLFANSYQRPADRPNNQGKISPVVFGPPYLTPPCTENIATLADCPLTGCGELGDAELNKAKNRTDAPSKVVGMTLDDIRQIPQPPRWNTGSDRSAIRGSGKEGSGVVVSGFLLKAKAEGKESCNCGLSHRVDTDVHLVVVSEMPSSKDKEAMDASERASVTAEITPRVRGSNEKWLYRNVNDFEGSYIRITGLLMLDTQHISQGLQLQGERFHQSLKRATNWEVHPITKIEICSKSKKDCDKGKGWKNY
jgi:hypothetical protein